MAHGSRTTSQNMELVEVAVENAEEFKYLGAIATWDNNDCSKDIQRGIQKASGAIAAFSTLWNSKGISGEY